MFVNHELDPGYQFSEIDYELKPLLDKSGKQVEGLFNCWIWLDNPKQYNSYSSKALSELIIATRRASADPSVVCVVLTAVGDKAFCTGGNITDYSDHYSGRPDEYRRYMRLFNDAISSLLHCDKPVINRANGMRIGGGQELGLACDFSIAADTAKLGQAGPKHGSAPVGGSTDLLPTYVGIGKAFESCVLCEFWSAHYAHYLGILTDIVPVLRVEGAFISNPLVITEFVTDNFGRLQYGQFKEGVAAEEAKLIMSKAVVDLSLLDERTEQMCTSLAETMPDCTTYTLEQLRKHKLQHWDKNRETSRAWLSLNMMTEGKMGFRTFERAPKEERQVDYIAMRQLLAQGERYGDSLSKECAPYAIDKDNEK